ncbi:TolC family protein [Stenotrophomonas maltophilia]|nr:TolC family protein [Stenotrophomonas maltophilia]HDS1219160.1 TolC family protein [Stenotrophomonas maltophilia]HDS1231297.1 TolC family protein [Stenotrophomonas maltophilia]
MPQRRSRRRWAGGAFALLLLCGLPAGASAMSVEQAVQTGLAIHPRVRAALSEAERAGTDVKIARGGYFPALQVSGGPQAGHMSEMVYDVTLSQMLFDWGRTRSQVEAASATQRRYLAALEVARDDAALDIIETYLDVLVARERVVAVRDFLQRIEGVRGMARDRSGSGYADRTELDRAQLEFARGQDQLAFEEGALRDANNQLALLLGRDPGPLQAPDLPAGRRAWQRDGLDAAIEAAPLLRESREDAAAAEAELAESRAALKPQLNVEASALRREIGGQMENDSVVSLRLRMDVLRGFSNFQRPAAARQRLEAAQWSADATRRDLRRKMRTLFDNADALVLREQALQQQVEESTHVGGLYHDQFQVGRRDIIDLLSVQRERMEAERQLATLRMERVRIDYRAAAQIGQLGELLGGRTHADAAH